MSSSTTGSDSFFVTFGWQSTVKFDSSLVCRVASHWMSYREIRITFRWFFDLRASSSSDSIDAGYSSAKFCDHCFFDSWECSDVSSMKTLSFPFSSVLWLYLLEETEGTILSVASVDTWDALFFLPIMQLIPCAQDEVWALSWLSFEERFSEVACTGWRGFKHGFSSITLCDCYFIWSFIKSIRCSAI